MSDMYFDTDTFNFDSLIDVVETTQKDFEKPYTKADEIDQSMGGVVDDASDLPQLEEPEEEKETNPNDDISDLLISEEEKAQAIEDFNYLPDDFLINFNGKYKTKAEVNQLWDKVEDLEAKEEHINATFEKQDQGTRWIYRESGVGLLEVNQKLQELEQEYRTAANQAIKGQISDEIIQYSQKREAMYNKIDQALAVNAAIEREGIANNTFQINNIMQKRYPDYQQVNAYSLEQMKKNGVSLSAYEKGLNVWLADKIYKASKAEMVEDQKVSQAYQRAEGKRVARSMSAANTANRVNPSDTAKAEAAALKAKMKKGGLTQKENSKMFDYLVD
ncbi:hypothetical protein IFY90_004254 [Salmonella enterica]|nr:hypothetical protein [Salmonella enterica]